jgi:hypothetical protein
MYPQMNRLHNCYKLHTVAVNVQVYFSTLKISMRLQVAAELVLHSEVTEIN